MKDDLVPDGVVHRFGERLEWSQSLSDEPAWVDFYRRVWPDLQLLVRVDRKGQWQRWGVDRVVYLPDGREIRIDEKKRAKDYGDVLLETYSVWHGKASGANKVGWALDRTKLCDYVAYAILPAQKCYLLPLDLLQRTFRRNGKDWLSTYKERFAANEGYQTRNIPVPWPVLSKALSAEMVTAWADNELLPLPPPRINRDNQFEFVWDSGDAA